MVAWGWLVGGATSICGWCSSGAGFGGEIPSPMGWCSTILVGTSVEVSGSVLDWSPLLMKESMVNWTVPGRGGGGRGFAKPRKNRYLRRPRKDRAKQFK